MPKPGEISTTDELKAVVDRRLRNVREDMAGAKERGEDLDVNYYRGQEHELATIQDLLCIILGVARTGYAATK